MCYAAVPERRARSATMRRAECPFQEETLMSRFFTLSTLLSLGLCALGTVGCGDLGYQESEPRLGGPDGSGDQDEDGAVLDQRTPEGEDVSAAQDALISRDPMTCGGFIPCDEATCYEPGTNGSLVERACNEGEPLGCSGSHCCNLFIFDLCSGTCPDFDDNCP
jgi:hypothetical protein